jgi:hypothetical protein
MVGVKLGKMNCVATKGKYVKFLLENAKATWKT